MAFDCFLKLDGIPGESADSKHKGEIDVMSYSFGATQTGSFAYGGGGGAGKVQFQDFHFVMKMSKATPKLFLACANGEHLKSAILTVRKAGKEAQEFYNVKFTDILVSSYTTGASGGGDEVPTEQISFNFTKMEMEYKEQKADGSLSGGVKAHYDAKINKGG